MAYILHVFKSFQDNFNLHSFAIIAERTEEKFLRKTRLKLHMHRVLKGLYYFGNGNISGNLMVILPNQFYFNRFSVIFIFYIIKTLNNTNFHGIIIS